MQVSVVHDALSLCKQLHNLMMIFFFCHNSKSTLQAQEQVFFSGFEGTEIFLKLFFSLSS